MGGLAPPHDAVAGGAVVPLPGATACRGKARRSPCRRPGKSSPCCSATRPRARTRSPAWRRGCCGVTRRRGSTLAQGHRGFPPAAAGAEYEPGVVGGRLFRGEIRGHSRKRLRSAGDRARPAPIRVRQPRHLAVRSVGGPGRAIDHHQGEGLTALSRPGSPAVRAASTIRSSSRRRASCLASPCIWRGTWGAKRCGTPSHQHPTHEPTLNRLK